MKTILFLCTGNYYRSRFAEEVFNFHADQKNLSWRADSAGLRVRETRAQNPGPISILVILALKNLDIIPKAIEREPKQVDEPQLRSADLIIATSLNEHESMARERIPQFLGKIIYWEVEDIGFEEPGKALLRLRKATLKLIDQLT